MKKFLLMICALAVAVVANAQIVSTYSQKITTTYKESNDYTRWYLGWNKMSFDKTEGDFNGVTLGWLRGINVTTLPIYVEIGAELAWTHYSYESDWSSYTYTDDIFSATIPVHVAYKFDLTDGISILPYTGPNLRFNVYDDDADSDDINLFQFGWNFGAGVTFNNLYLGYKITTNMTSYFDYKGTNHNGNGIYHLVSLGYQF